MIANIKKTFPPKTGMQKSNFCKIQGMSEVSKVHAVWYLARLYEYYVEGVERNKIIIKPIHKVRFEKFICHVRGVKGSVHIHQ